MRQTNHIYSQCFGFIQQHGSIRFRESASHSLRYFFMERNATHEHGFTVQINIGTLHRNITKTYLFRYAISSRSNPDFVQFRGIGRPTLKLLHCFHSFRLSFRIGIQLECDFQFGNGYRNLLAGFLLGEPYFSNQSIRLFFIQLDDIFFNISLRSSYKQYIASDTAIVPPIERQCGNSIFDTAIIDFYCQEIITFFQ